VGDENKRGNECAGDRNSGQAPWLSSRQFGNPESAFQLIGFQKSRKENGEITLNDTKHKKAWKKK
jgi:hypothetical protein